MTKTLMLDALLAQAPTVDSLVATMKARGRPELTLAECGAAPGTAGRGATRAALKLARDAFKAPGLPPGRRTLRVPPGGWTPDRPVLWDTSSVTIKGEGPDSTLAPAGASAFPALVVGMSPAPMGHAMTTDHGADAFGRLDASAAPSPGRRWSWRNRDDTHLAAWASQWNLGPAEGWSSVKSLVVELALDASAIPINRAHLCGMSTGPEARPWFVYGTPGRVNLRLRLRGRAAPLEVAVPYTPAAKVERFGFQIDFAAGAALGWHDGAIAPLLGDPPPAGSRLADNENEPFHVGGSGSSAAHWFGEFFQGNASPDLDLLGLRVGAADRYAAAPAGAPLARLDGGPVNDDYAYFAADSGTVGVLPLDEDPATLAGERTIRSESGLTFNGQGARYGVLYAVDRMHSTEYTEVEDVRLEDLTFRCGPFHGDALTIAAALHVRADRVRFLGGAHGVGTPNWLANYYHHFNNCTFQGSDASLYLWKAQGTFRDCESLYLGRRTLWLVGSRVAVEHWPMPNAWLSANRPEALLYAWGGETSALDVAADIEDGGSPTAGLFWAVATDWENTPSGAFLELARCGAGSPLKTVPLVRLDSRPNYKLGQARVRDCWTMGPCAATVQTSGGWDCAIDNLVRPTYPACLDLTPSGPPAGWKQGTVAIIAPAGPARPAPAP